MAGQPVDHATLFIASLAFGEGATLDAAKVVAILIASVAAGLHGYVVLRRS